MRSQASIKIDQELCQTCKECLARKVCKVKAIVQLDPGESPFVDLSYCFDCRLCIPACPLGAVSAQPAS
jgi:Fe-S-cluster-containing hydrogenase component 2